MYVLSTRPELQEQLRQEIQEYIPGNLRDFPTDTLADTLERLPLLNAIIQETLRLYPTIPFTSRLANKDTTVLGHYIPKGTPFLMSPWAINRSPDLWGPGAEEFKPERWITNGKPNNHGGAPSVYCVLTFLHGPRNCIGQGFAKAELRCLLAALATTFKWTLSMPVEDVIPFGVISVKPKNGMWLNMTKRTNE
jgi:cytochrome P450